MNTSPAPMLSELGKKQVEEVFHETGLSSGEKVTQEIASAMHVDFSKYRPTLDEVLLGCLNVSPDSNYVDWLLQLLWRS